MIASTRSAKPNQPRCLMNCKKDIVDRIRGQLPHGSEAADEIERLRELLMDMEIRVDVPFLLSLIDEGCHLSVWSDGSCGLYDNTDGKELPVSKGWGGWDHGRTLFDTACGPSLSVEDLLHDGALVELESGDQLVIRKSGNRKFPWQCGTMLWNEAGEIFGVSVEHKCHIAEVIVHSDGKIEIPSEENE